jgi:ABC-2 type transport system ATP-binding protein
MDEAERLCDRVAVVDHGKVIAEGSPRELIASLGGEHILDFSLMSSNGDPPLASTSLSDLPAVRSVRVENGTYSLAVTEPHIALPALLDRLRQSNRELSNLSTRHASLEDVFVTLTGRHLREEATTS